MIGKENLLKILVTANLCNLSYREPNELLNICNYMPGYRHLIESSEYITNEETDAQAYIFYDTEVIYVCFRGTSSLKDKVTDLRLSMKTFLHDEVKVHKGFYTQYSSISDKIKLKLDYLIKKYNQNNIICCGHSLGGGLSTICAVDLKYSNYKDINLSNITFGSPRVGNTGFKNLYGSIIKPCNSFRITDENDPITYVPIYYKYHHIDDAYCLCENKISIKNEQKWHKRLPHALKNMKCCCQMFDDHSMDNYINLLKKNIEARV